MSKKVVTLAQLLENAQKSEALTMQVARAVEAELEGKANKKYVDDAIGDIASILDTINGEVV